MAPYVWVSGILHVDLIGFTTVCVDLSTHSCNLVHMTASSAHTSHPSGTALGGVPVVPGVAYAPVIRPGRLPSSFEDAGDLAEPDRPAEVERFTAAVSTVATRLRDRAAHATGAASEVLAATATLAQDRAWLGAAEKRITAGAP